MESGIDATLRQKLELSQVKQVRALVPRAREQLYPLPWSNVEVRPA